MNRIPRLNNPRRRSAQPRNATAGIVPSRPSSWLRACVLLLLLTACDARTPNMDDLGLTPGIQGVVTDAVSRRAKVEATVSVQRRTSRTDSNGHYRDEPKDRESKCPGSRLHCLNQVHRKYLYLGLPAHIVSPSPCRIGTRPVRRFRTLAESLAFSTIALWCAD